MSGAVKFFENAAQSNVSIAANGEMLQRSACEIRLVALLPNVCFDGKGKRRRGRERNKGDGLQKAGDFVHG